MFLIYLSPALLSFSLLGILLEILRGENFPRTGVTKRNLFSPVGWDGNSYRECDYKSLLDKNISYLYLYPYLHLHLYLSSPMLVKEISSVAGYL